MDNKNIGLIGLGQWGKNILRNLSGLGVLEAACDLSEGIIAGAGKTYPGLRLTRDPSTILGNPRVRAVAIATPASTHYKLAKEAMLAGKDVFIEKPISLATGEGEELVRLADSMDRILMVGHILQYHPAVLRLKELLSEGVLGKIQYIYSNRLNIGKIRTEEDIIWSFAPHDVSAILMLLDEEPVRVSAIGGDYLNKGIYDTTLTSLEFKNNVRAHIFVSWLHPFKEQKLVVIGSKAMAVFDDLIDDKLCFYPHSVEWIDGKIPVAHKAERQNIKFDMKEPLNEEMLHFIDCVRNRTKPRTDGREGLRVLRILEKAETDLRSH